MHLKNVSNGYCRKCEEEPMNKSKKDFVTLLKNALVQSNETLTDVNYSELEILAVNHICLSLISEGALLAGLDLPERWKNYCFYISTNNYRNLAVQSEVLNILKRNNIKCAVLKGITVSKFYHEPLYRPLGDIDILVEKDKYDKAIDILTNSKERNKESEKHKFHYGFVYNDVRIEIHKSMTEYSEGEYGAMLDDYLKNVLNTVCVGKYEKFEFPMLEPKFHIISMVLHTQRHFAEHKTTMRMICDFAAVTQNTDRDTWNNEIYPALKKLKLERFTDALLRLCMKYFGAKFAFEIKCEIDEMTVDNLLSEFLNDGLKAEYDDINNISFKEKIKSIFITIKEIIHRDFKITKKLSFLMPIFYLYVPMRSIFRKIVGRRKNIGVFGYGISYNRRISIIKELNIVD